MNNNTDSNLAFWIEWAKLTQDQRRELLPHIHDASILAEMAIDETSKNGEGVGAWALHRINDDATLLFVATRTCNADITMRVVRRLTPPSLRRLFDEPNVLNRGVHEPKLLKDMVGVAANTEEEDGFIDYYGRHQSVYVRFCAFNRIIGWLVDVTNDERDKYLQALQDMMLREPNAECAAAMQQKLDHLTEDHI